MTEEESSGTRSQRMLYVNIGLTCLSTIGMLLSLTAISTIVYFRKLRKRTSNKLLVNLFLADFGVCLLMLVFHALMIDPNSKKERVEGIKNAKEFHIILSAFMLLSITNRIAVTIDRALAVKKPFYYQSKFNTMTVVKITIFQDFAAVVYLVILYLAHHWMDKDGFSDLFSLLFIIVVGTGFLVLTASNIIVYIEAHRQIEMICKITYVDSTKKRRTCQIQKESKIVRINLGMVIAFVVCWTPFLAAICQEHVKGEYRDLLTVSIHLLALNYILDPIIYVSLSRDVRKQLKELFCKKSKRTCSETGSTSLESVTHSQ
ncbi:histamine H2 receptor-like [Clytia hemisphaerica]|uniref:G-protein coupled receptors family 1 profile domain-containing protein n=1 Tax=Clytia hemisphaerica TaxID=252671 RepID=A0A7M5UF87_9CNID|eukprot:TCONS_00046220-protein